MHTLRLVEVRVATVIAEIRRLGLEVAAHKIGTIWIHDLLRLRRPPQTWMKIDEDRSLTKIRSGTSELYRTGV